jgi:hypothetical protein
MSQSSSSSTCSYSDGSSSESDVEDIPFPEKGTNIVHHVTLESSVFDKKVSPERGVSIVKNNESFLFNNAGFAAFSNSLARDHFEVQPIPDAVIYRDSKGTRHRRQEKVRTENKKANFERKDWVRAFADQFVKGDIKDAETLVRQFNHIDGKKGTACGDGLVLPYFLHGASNGMMKKVFKLGSHRCTRLRKMCKLSSGDYENSVVVTAKSKNYHNPNAFTKDDIQNVHDFVQVICKNKDLFEEGYPCGHRRIHLYCTDMNAANWKSFWNTHYVPYCNVKNARKMSYESFYNFMRDYYPFVRTKRLQTDYCDVCLELETGMFTFAIFNVCRIKCLNCVTLCSLSSLRS